MASLVSRLVACLVAVVAILQLIHLVLLNKLESSRLTELHHLQQQQQQQQQHHHHHGQQNQAQLGGNNLEGEQQDKSYSVNNKVHERKPRRKHAATEEYEFLVNRLLRDEGTIVDSSGEYRIIFEIAGPRSDFSSTPIPPMQQDPKGVSLSVGMSNTDDFSIDDEIFEAESSGDVTLVSHSDLENARRYLFPLVTRWDGPISLALFASNSTMVEATLQFIAQARLCSEMIKRNVNFHLVFPLVESQFLFSENKRNSKIPVHSILDVETDTETEASQKRKPLFRVNSQMCQYFRKDLLKMSKKLVTSSAERTLSSYESGSFAYPTNLLKNIARKRVLTDFSLISDIDMLPSSGLRSKFQKFAKDKELLKPNGDEKKSVFVVPAFESKNGDVPGSKAELLKLIDNFEARPFYFDMCWKCQVHTDYETWQRERSSPKDELSVLFEVLWKDPWEPFFIADNSIPLFDERFRQGGFNRISQLCELHVAGYKFPVLNEAFLIHPGYITTPTFNPVRARDVDTNRAHFRQFKNELKDKYPHSTRRCY